MLLMWQVRERSSPRYEEHSPDDDFPLSSMVAVIVGMPGGGGGGGEEDQLKCGLDAVDSL